MRLFCAFSSVQKHAVCAFIIRPYIYVPGWRIYRYFAIHLPADYFEVYCTELTPLLQEIYKIFELQMLIDSTVCDFCFSLTLSPPIPLMLYTLPYRSNPSFLIFDIRALWRSGLSARAHECQKLKMVG